MIRARLLFVAALLLSGPASAQIPTPGTTVASAPGFETGRFYGPRTLANTNATPAANKLLALPFYVPNTITAASLNFNIQTVSAGNWNARMCIYDNSGGVVGMGQPGSLVGGSDTGNLAFTSASTGAQTAAISVALRQGWYYLAFTFDSGSSPLISSASTSLGGGGQDFIGSTTFNIQASSNVGWTAALSYTSTTACPASFGSATAASSIPYVGIGT